MSRLGRLNWVALGVLVAFCALLVPLGIYIHSIVREDATLVGPPSATDAPGPCR